MTAKIVQFPKKTPSLNFVKSIDLQHCWDRRLQNPYLNSLYKSEISYAERWYLQVVHHLNFDELEHPLVKILLNHSDYTLNLLLSSVSKDLTIQLAALEANNLPNPYTMSAEYNVSRLNKWKNKWTGLIKYRDQL
jgi:hypothetical protein